MKLFNLSLMLSAFSFVSVSYADPLPSVNCDYGGQVDVITVTGSSTPEFAAKIKYGIGFVGGATPQQSYSVTKSETFSPDATESYSGKDFSLVLDENKQTGILTASYLGQSVGMVNLKCQITDGHPLPGITASN